MENLGYYIFCILAFIVAFLVVKKIAGCLIKTVILVAIVAALAAVYFLYVRQRGCFRGSLRRFFEEVKEELLRS